MRPPSGEGLILRKAGDTQSRPERQRSIHINKLWRGAADFLLEACLPTAYPFWGFLVLRWVACGQTGSADDPASRRSSGWCPAAWSPSACPPPAWQSAPADQRQTQGLGEGLWNLGLGRLDGPASQLGFHPVEFFDVPELELQRLGPGVGPVVRSHPWSWRRSTPTCRRPSCRRRAAKIWAVCGHPDLGGRFLSEPGCLGWLGVGASRNTGPRPRCWPQRCCP